MKHESYATIENIKRRIKQAVENGKYHISVTIHDEEGLVCDCYCCGIETKEVISLLNDHSEGAFGK